MPNAFDQFDTDQANPFDQFDQLSPDQSAALAQENLLMAERPYYGTGTTPFSPLTDHFTPDPEAQKALASELVNLPGQVAGGISRIIRPVAHEMAKDIFIRPPTEEESEEGKSVFAESLPLADPKYRGVIPALTRQLAGLTGEEGIVTLPTTPLKPVQAYYGLTAAASLPESIRALGEARTPEERRDAATAFGINTLMAAFMARAAAKGKGYATEKGRIEEGAEREYPGDGTRGAPAEAGGRGGVPPATGVEEKAQVLLKPEEQAYLDAERESIDAPVEVTETAPAEGAPFAGQIATIDRKAGKILINPQNFSLWLQDVPEARRPLAVRSLLNEERIHLAVDDESALGYWNSLTAAEKLINQRRYTGRFKGAGLSDMLMGHEALRFRMQQLSRMTPREIAEAGLRERWTVQGLTAVESAIRTVRETLGTKSSGTQRAILDRMMANLATAKYVASGGAQPAAMLKQYESDTGKKFRPEDYGDEDIKFTVMKFPEMPQLKGAVQADSVKNGVNEWSTNPNDLRSNGFDVPSSEEMLSKLPAGQYTLGQVKQMLAGEPKVYDLEEAAAELRRQPGREFVPAIKDASGKVTEGFSHDELRRTGITGTPGFTDAQGNFLTAAEVARRKGAGPSAIRKKGIPEDYPELFKRISKKGGLTAPETEPAGEMLAKAAAARYQPITPQIVQGEIQNHLATATRPNFSDFADTVRARYGDVKPEQLREAWRDNIWNHLVNASGAELTRIRRTLGIGREVGFERAIPDALPPEKGFQLEMQPEGGMKKLFRLEDEQTRQRIRSEQNYRANVIATIGQKLINESETGRKAWNRKEVNPEEIGFWRRSSEPAWNPITSEDAANPDVLGRILTADAREEATTKTVKPGTATEKPVEIRRKAPPVSVTKRLTALLNRQTGKVELVSTYRDGRRGAVLFDPIAPGRTHSPIKSILNRFRPLYSVLLDEPVQNFRMTFDSIRDFEDKFGGDARRLSDENAAKEAGLTGEAGILEGTPEVPSALAPGQRLTDSEAGAFLDNLNDEVGKIDSPEDVRLLVDGLHDRFTRDALDGRDWSTIGALQKITNAIRRKWRQLTPDQAKDQAFDELYDLAKNSANREDFQAKAIGRYAPQTRRPLPGVPRAAGPPAVSPTARELTMRGRIPPTVDPNVAIPRGPGPEPRLPAPRPVEMLTPEEREYVEAQVEAKAPGELSPGALRKAKAVANEESVKAFRELKALVSRVSTKRNLPRIFDGQERAADQYARQAGEIIRTASAKSAKKPDLARAKQIREAAKAVIASTARTIRGDEPLLPGQFTPNGLDILRKNVESGILKASNWLVSQDRVKRLWGRRWLQAANRLKAELDFARDNWDDPELQRTADQLMKEAHEEVAFENANGFNVRERNYYIPGRYEGDFWNDRQVSFAPLAGTARLLGEQFRTGKKFRDYYDAIQYGPYIPATYDAATLMESRIRSGRYRAAHHQAFELFKQIRDPVTGKPIARDPKMVPVEDPETGQKHWEYFPPDAEHQLVWPTDKKRGVPLAVRAGYFPAVESLTDRSQLGRLPGGKELLLAASMLKHGWLLIGDIYHYARLKWYGASLSGRKWFEINPGYKGGYAVLNWREADLPEAVQKGFVTQAAADWALGEVPIRMPDGTTRMFTRHKIGSEILKQGLNASRIMDALYKDAVRRVPFLGETWHKIIGPYNHWLFDKYTSGLMLQMAVTNFERLHEKFPDRPLHLLTKDIVTHINAEFGNMGRQGIFKNPTFRDVAQTLLLAPMWREGIIGKELITYSNLLKAAGHLAAGDLAGARYRLALPVTRSMMRGIFAFTVLTQVLNLITRRQFTWQNPEKDHKLDAFIPTGKDTGFWLSPMSVFMELTHDVTRILGSKPRAHDVLLQIGANALGPVGKAAHVLATGEDEMGRRISTTPRILSSAAGQLAPMPISFGAPVQTIGHALAPGLVSPPRRGMLARQALGWAGMKVQPSESALMQAQKLASDYAEKNKLKPDTGFYLQPTDAPSYSRLRSAIRNDDVKEAKRVFEKLRETHPLKKDKSGHVIDDPILKAMAVWAKRPLTGSLKGDRDFIGSLNDQQLDLISAAQQERLDTLNKYVDWYVTHAAE